MGGLRISASDVTVCDLCDQQLLDFSHRALPHFHRVGARRDGLRQEKIPPRTRVADALRNSRQTYFNRRARRIRAAPVRDQIFRAQFFGDGKNTFIRREGNGFVHRRMMQPKFAQFFRREQRRCARREIFRAAAAGRAWSSPRRPASSFREPEFAERMADWLDDCDVDLNSISNFGFQRRWTQNQFAGSRRTAVSKARFTSRMMSAVERASPFSRVGISSPTSIRHFARPMR